MPIMAKPPGIDDDRRRGIRTSQRGYVRHGDNPIGHEGYKNTTDTRDKDDADSDDRTYH